MRKRNPESVPVRKPRFTSRAKDPASTGRVYTVRAVGNESIGGQLQIAGRSIGAKGELFAGLRDYVVSGGTIVIGYLDDLRHNPNVTIKTL